MEWFEAVAIIATAVIAIPAWILVTSVPTECGRCLGRVSIVLGLFGLAIAGIGWLFN